MLLNREVVGALPDWDDVFLCNVDAVLNFEGFKKVKGEAPAVWVGPGGVWPPKDQGSEKKKREREEELEAERRVEVVCDGCGEKVGEGDAWYECESCFGYDLCGGCYEGGVRCGMGHGMKEGR